MTASAAGRLLAIFVEGDRRRGLGHVVRCTGFARRWREAGGATRWVIDGDRGAFEMASPVDELVAARWQEQPSAYLPGIAAAIVDSYEAPAETYAAIAAAAPSVFLDDLERLDYPPGLVIHSSPGPVAATPGGARWETGPHWQSLRDAFLDVHLRTAVRDRVERVLILTGGTDLRGLAARMSDLARVAFPDAAIDAVLGAGAGPGAAVATARVHHDVGADGMRDLMRNADLAITAAGQSTYELARCGTPMILVGVVENQRKHFDQWPKVGAAVAAGWWDDPALDAKVTAALTRYAEPGTRLAAAIAGQDAIDGRGAERAVGYLLEAIANGSNASD